MLVSRFDEDMVRSFLDPLTISFDGQEVTISCPHRYFSASIPDFFLEALKEEFSSVQGRNTVVHIQNASAFRPFPSPLCPPSTDRFPFGSTNTFEKFLVNKKNFFPMTSAQKIAEGEETGFNPFVVCGPSGTGKTHLAMAMANRMADRMAQESILATTGDDLSRSLNQKFQSSSGHFQSFMDGFQAVVLDNFHEVEEDDFLQAELIRIFDFFQSDDRQMVFCLDRPVSTLKHTRLELKSRIESGLVVALKEPDLDIRIRAAGEFVAQHRIKLARQQILTLAMQCESFRSLRGMLLKIKAFTGLVRRDMSDHDFHNILDSTRDHPSPHVTVDSILKTVSTHLDLRIQDLASSSRKREIVFARQAAMFLCREHLGLSYAEIGKVFGGRDHSTVIHNLQKIKQIQNDDPKTKQTLRRLSNECVQGSKQPIFKK